MAKFTYVVQNTVFNISLSSGNAFAARTSIPTCSSILLSDAAAATSAFALYAPVSNDKITALIFCLPLS